MNDLIRRYDIVIFENDWMRQESPTGDYVRYEDHAIEIERLTADNDHLTKSDRVWLEANQQKDREIERLEDRVDKLVCLLAERDAKIGWLLTALREIAECQHLETGCEHDPAYACPICTARAALKGADDE